MESKVTFKSISESFTIVGDFVVNEQESDRVIKMTQIDTQLLPINLEDLFKTNQFCAVFPHYFYSDKKWYVLDEPYNDMKVFLIPSSTSYIGDDINIDIDCPLCAAIKQEDIKRYLPREFTLFLSTSKNTRMLQDKTTKGIILSHVVPEKVVLGSEPKELETMTMTRIKYSPLQTIEKSKISKVIDNGNHIIYIIDDFLPVEEQKSFTIDDSHMSSIMTEMLVDYFKVKIDIMTRNMENSINQLKKVPNKNLISACLLDCEVSKMLRQLYSIQ